MLVSGVSGLVGIFPHGRFKLTAASRGTNFARQNILERYKLSVEKMGFVFILRHYGTAQIDAGKESARPRVRQHFRFHFPISIRARVPTYRDPLLPMLLRRS